MVWINAVVVFILVLAVGYVPTARASGIDLHWLWDNRCSECHGHSAEFARKFLQVSGDELQGPHHIENLRLFLHNHYPAGNEVDGIYDMLRAQAITPTHFRDECSRCHLTAAEFVRESLVFREGVLYGLDSNEAVQDVLAYHRRLKPDDIRFFTELLTRVGHEVFRPE